MRPRRRVTGYQASLASALPSWAHVTRGAGSWSEQTAAAANGTTFLTRGTAENTARFWYSSTLGRRGLILEPTRTNIVTYNNPVDGAEGNANQWDNWGAIAGTPGVDFSTTAAVGPHGGYIGSLLDTATANRGFTQTSMTITGSTQYAWSVWTRRTGTAGAASMYAFNGGVNATITLDATLHDWQREQVVASSTSGAGGVYACANGDPPGVIQLALVQMEAGGYASSNIFSAAGASGTTTRAAELCAIDSIARSAYGYLGLVYEPFYAYNSFSTVHTLFEFAPGWRLDYNGGTDTFDVVVNGTVRATSASQTFAARSVHSLGVYYGASGTRLVVDGVGTSNATAWGTPTIASYLGSRAASANAESAIYWDLVIA